MATKATSVYLDEGLVDMMDDVIALSRLAGVKMSRSMIVSTALLGYLKSYREQLIADVDLVRERIDAHQASLAAEDFGLGI